MEQEIVYYYLKDEQNHSFGCVAIYENEDGTSMACPFVTAAAALLLSDSPSMTYQEVTRKLEEMAIDLGDVGYDIHYGYGRVNNEFQFLFQGLDFNYYYK